MLEVFTLKNRNHLLMTLLILAFAGCTSAKPDSTLPRDVPFSNSPLSQSEMQKFEGRWVENDASSDDHSYTELRTLRSGIMEMRSDMGEKVSNFGVGPVFLTRHKGNAYLSMNLDGWTWKPGPPLPQEFLKSKCFVTLEIRILSNGDFKAERADKELTIEGNPNIRFPHPANSGTCISDILTDLSAQDRERVMLIPAKQTENSRLNLSHRIEPPVSKP